MQFKAIPVVVCVCRWQADEEKKRLQDEINRLQGSLKQLREVTFMAAIYHTYCARSCVVGGQRGNTRSCYIH